MIPWLRLEFLSMIRLHEDWGHHVTLEDFHDMSCEVVHEQGLLWDSRHLLDLSLCPIRNDTRAGFKGF